MTTPSVIKPVRRYERAASTNCMRASGGWSVQTARSKPQRTGQNLLLLLCFWMTRPLVDTVFQTWEHSYRIPEVKTVWNNSWVRARRHILKQQKATHAWLLLKGVGGDRTGFTDPKHDNLIRLREKKNKKTGNSNIKQFNCRSVLWQWGLIHLMIDAGRSRSQQVRSSGHSVPLYRGGKRRGATRGR